ncbi:MAG: vitamin K epoxide reductase family protein [Nanoarchaeota archaeon]
MRQKFIHASIIVFIIVNIVFSFIIFYSSLQGSTFCTFGDSSCKQVQSSVYNTLFGIPLSLLGLLSFIFLLYLYLHGLTSQRAHYFFHLGVFVSFIFALYLIFLQFFILKAFCSSCMIVDVLTIILFVLSLGRKL